MPAAVPIHLGDALVRPRLRVERQGPRGVAVILVLPEDPLQPPPVIRVHVVEEAKALPPRQRERVVILSSRHHPG